MPYRLSSAPVLKAAFTFGAMLLCVGLSAGPISRRPAVPDAAARLAAMPLVFEQNVGQAKGDVEFLARGQGYTLGLNGSETLLSLQAPENSPQRTQRTRSKPEPPNSALPNINGDPSGAPEAFSGSSVSSVTSVVKKQGLLKMRLVGANPKAKAVGEKRLKAKINYFIGNDPKKWKTDVPAFEAVRTKDVYPGIDLVHYGQATGALEYDLVVAPGVDPGQVEFEVDGVDSMRLAASGDLILQVAGGEVRQERPICYQEGLHGRVEVQGEFVLSGDFQRIGVRLGNYDAGRPLVIDPVLMYSTYLGGTDSQSGRGIAAGNDGLVYVAGGVTSTDFPTVGTFQGFQGNVDTFVSVLDPSKSGANSLLYSTYLGGSGFDHGWEVATDGNGRAIVTGETSSSNFPTLGAYSTYQGGTDVTITVLDPTLSGAASLLYSTFLGGSGSDVGRGVAADVSGRVYVTGSTGSANFPVLNAYQGDQVGSDAFVTALDTTLSGSASLVYSSYLGGDSGTENALGIATDGSGKAYVAGYTQSTDFPIVNEFQINQPSDDGFVSVVDTTLSGAGSLLYSTYLGGNSLDRCTDVDCDSTGRAFVTGWTVSADFQTRNAFQASLNNADIFVVALDPTVSGPASCLYSTFFGGTNSEDSDSYIATDGGGRVFVTSKTPSSDFPLVSSLYTQKTHFLSLLDTNAAGAASLLFSTYFGNAANFEGLDTDGNGRVCITGFNSANVPMVNAYQTSGVANSNFISVFNFAPLAATGLTAVPATGTRAIDLAWTDNA